MLLDKLPYNTVFLIVLVSSVLYVGIGFFILTGWLSKIYFMNLTFRKRLLSTIAIATVIPFIPFTYTLINYAVKDVGIIDMEEFGNNATPVLVHYGNRPPEREISLTKTTIGQLKEKPTSPVNIGGQNILFVHTNGEKTYVDANLFGGYKKRSYINLYLARTKEFSLSFNTYLNTDIPGTILREEPGGYIADNITVGEIANAILNSPIQFKDNWISELPKGWKKPFIRKTAIEIRNEYNIPIFVLEYKSPYEIVISGVFYSSFGIMKIDNSQDITFHFASDLRSLGTYKVDNVFIHSISDFFVSEKSYNLYSDYSEKGILQTFVSFIQHTLGIPSHEVKNLVIRVTSFPATPTTPNGLLVEFSDRWDEIDPISISANISGTRLDSQFAWWAKPNHQGFDISEIVSFRKGVINDAFSGSSNINLPTYSFYSVGKPLDASNSLHLWFYSPEALSIDSIVFQGQHFVRIGNSLVWDRR